MASLVVSLTIRNGNKDSVTLQDLACQRLLLSTKLAASLDLWSPLYVEKRSVEK
ncbi:hypothetical protein PGTUg99_037382 [Puccinia graminis f. sp. tritici]|uniref:Uncharacterized protein n=1 Tax=Puccinia graminis f. sp. tritici TaxID=56615 RepID=A0A5B0SNJ0_PUCGR|nr:hypothetical protein PGTUg99_037382 [Puccinia graminis f. sp. tritici]